MLALARAVATSPRLLMLDELSMGLAPLIVDELYSHVVRLVAEGITVVVVEQFARTALSVATSAIVMANGRIVQTGAASDVESVLQSAYLGPVQPAGPGSPATQRDVRSHRHGTGTARARVPIRKPRSRGTACTEGSASRSSGPQ